MQLFWLVDRLISLNAKGADGLLLGLLRQINAGERSSENLFTIKSIIRLVHDHITWLTELSTMIPYVLYSCLRILSEDFVESGLEELLSDICITLLHQKYRECSVLGRDLARCLVEVSRLPKFSSFWHWLLQQKEGEVAPIVRLLLTPTPKKYMLLRIRPRAETDLQFLLEHSLTVQQNFYIPLFFATHIPQAEGDDTGALIIDAIRYIVVALRPSKPTIASTTLPAWSFVTSLLKAVRTSYSAASAKLALFIDWLFFDAASDNSLCLEPGLLVMTKSVAGNPNITTTLLEYLKLAKDNFYPPLESECTRCINKAMKICIESRFVTSIDGLLTTPMLSIDIKNIAESLFTSSLNSNLVTEGGMSDSSIPLKDQRALGNENRDHFEQIVLALLTSEADINSYKKELESEPLRAAFVEILRSVIRDRSVGLQTCIVPMLKIACTLGTPTGEIAQVIKDHFPSDKETCAIFWLGLVDRPCDIDNYLFDILHILSGDADKLLDICVFLQIMVKTLNPSSLSSYLSTVLKVASALPPDASHLLRSGTFLALKSRTFDIEPPDLMLQSTIWKS